MGPRRIMLLLMLAAGQAFAQSAEVPPGAPTAVAGSAKRIFLPPALQWDHAMLGYHAASQQTAADFAGLAGGLAFGMSPEALNARLSEPYAGLSWNTLSPANEYPAEAWYFGVQMGSVGVLRLDLTACTGGGSYLVFLFNTNGLFRISYRLAADEICPDTNEAAQQIFARYVSLGRGVAASTRYRTGQTHVVDITDPTAGALIPVRWRQGDN
jgi:hypothetical protein